MSFGVKSGVNTEKAKAPTPTSSKSTGWLAVALVSIVALVLAGFAVFAAFKPGAKFENETWVNQGLTAEVTAAAKNAVETLYAYNFETIDEDFDRTRSLLTPEMVEEFNKTADTTKSAAVQTSTKLEAMVTDIGIMDLQQDEASVLAYINVSATGDGIAQGSVGGPIQVTMVRRDGNWLLSYISDSAS